MKPMGDVKVKRLGRQFLINIPRTVVESLNLGPGTMTITGRSENQLILEKGPGSVKVVDVGGGKLRLYISVDEAPFRENERVIVMARDNRLVVKRINYYIAKPTIKPGQYRVNLPWELVEKTGLDKYELVKIHKDENKIIIEPLEEDP